MSVMAIRSAIGGLLRTVPDIGVVHEYERYAADLKKLAALYFDSRLGRLQGWFVRRMSTAETGQLRTDTVERIRWRIVGVMAFNDADASELTFDALIESVRDTFRADDTLGGTVDQCSVPVDGGGANESAIQLDDNGPVMFGGVLCHSARLGLNTIRYLESP